MVWDLIDSKYCALNYLVLILVKTQDLHPNPKLVQYF